MILRAAGSIAKALSVLLLARTVYEKLPACWLCEYDEQPWEMHMPGFRGLHGKGLYAALFMVMVVSFSDIQIEVHESRLGFMIILSRLTCAAAICVCAVAISLSDIDYMIVPDQLVTVIGGCAVIMGLVGSASAFLFTEAAFSDCVKSIFSEVLFGAAAGTGLMLLSSAMGLLTGKGAACGFGDVKLMAVCGAVAGEKVFIMYILMAVMSGLYFCIGVVAGKIRYGSGQPLAPWICVAMMLCM